MLHVASVCTPFCMLLDVVACCCAKFETLQAFQPKTPNISFIPWSPKRSATMLDPFAQLFQHCWGCARASRMVYKDLWVVSFPRCTAGLDTVGSCCVRLHTSANTHAALSFLLHSITSPHPTWRTSFNIPVQVFVLLDIFCVRFPSSQNNCHVRVLRASSPSRGLILWSHRRLASLDPLSPPPSRSLWLAPFPPLFVSFNMALCEQKHSRAQKKRLHCRIASYFIWV